MKIKKEFGLILLALLLVGVVFASMENVTNSAFSNETNNTIITEIISNETVSSDNISTPEESSGDIEISGNESNGVFAQSTDIGTLDASNSLIAIERVHPLSDVSVEQFSYFNITVNVSCTSGNCGEINVSFDPEEEEVYNFTTCGADDRFEVRTGPSQSDCNSEYSGTNLEGEVVVSGGLQSWTVPSSGYYNITAFGAAGGRQGEERDGYVDQRAEGVIISGTFFLEEGETIQILAGQIGHDDEMSSAGAGGGSFVVDSNDNPILIAGGGGGGGYRQDSNRGRPGTSGGVASGGAGIPGSNGQGGQNGGGGAGGGGGFYTDGQDSAVSSATGGAAFLNSATGGAGSSSTRDGGFGGGAGNGNFGVGGPGGGGYSGGASGDVDGSPYDQIQSGGGGGSFIRADVQNPATSDGTWTTTGDEPDDIYEGSVDSLGAWNDNQGKIIITKLGVKGLISDTIGDTPFYTNESNPRTITLDEGESQLVTAWVNATGSLGDYLFFEFANVTLAPNINAITSNYTVTIVDTTPPVVNISYPLAISYPSIVQQINFTAADHNLDSCWYSLDEGQTNETVPCNEPIEDLVSVSGQNNWTVWANDTSGNVGNATVSFFVEIPTLNIERINPFGNISVEQFSYFNVTVNVSCSVANCGEINVSFDPEELLNYTFTTCGATGRFGPSQANCNSEYTGTSLESEVTIIGDGIQEWVVPKSGKYRLNLLGAQGATGTGSGIGGLGANISGEFDLVEGDVLRVLVGQEGISSGRRAPGGGGTFVVIVNETSTYEMFDGTRVNPLVIAGGGGGFGTGFSDNNQDITHASNETSGNAGVGGTNSGTGGVNGQGGDSGGSSCCGGSGGGGFLGNGSQGPSSGQGGRSFLSGGLGGSESNQPGSFGGGGSVGSTGWGAGGGGGGYSGGGGSYSSSDADEGAGGGGGSYNIGENQSNIAGVNFGDGSVIITLLDNSKGLISDTIGDTPFYTNESNPRTITLHEGESQLVTAWVNATGGLGDYLFFEFVNLTLDPNVGAITSNYTVTVIDTVPPNVTIHYPQSTIYGTNITELNFTAIDHNLASCWYSLDGGVTNHSTPCNEVITGIENDGRFNTWTIWAEDTSGNVGNATVDFEVEITELDMALISPISNITVIRNNLFEVIFNVSCFGQVCAQTEVNITGGGTPVIVFNAKDKNSLDSLREAPFIDFLNDSGYIIEVISDTEVSGYDFSDTDLLIVRADNDFYISHPFNLNSLNLPILSMNRHTSRINFGMASSSSTQTTNTYVIMDNTHPITEGLSGSFAVYNQSGVHQRISWLASSISLPVRTTTGTAGVAIKEGNNLPGNYTRAHWSAHRGHLLTEDGWLLFDNLVQYMADGKPDTGILSTNPDTPFWVPGSNPQYIDLNQTNNTLVTFLVNASGSEGDYSLMGVSSLSNAPAISSESDSFMVTITSEPDTMPPEVNLSSPLDNHQTINPEATFVANLTDNVWLKNASLIIKNATGDIIVTEHFNLTGTSQLINSTISLPYKGVFTWTILAHDLAGNNASGAERTLTYAAPRISIERMYPTQDLNLTQGDWFNITLNVTCYDEDCGDVDISFDPRSVYVLTDGNIECVSKVQPILEDVGFAVTCGIDEWTFNGTNVDIQDYDGVVLLNGDSWEQSKTMPQSGQDALADYVEDGGGLIIFEWTAFQEYSTGIRLLDRQSGSSTSQTVHINLSHPITQGLPSSWVANLCGYNIGNKNAGTVLAYGSSSKDYLVIDERGSGRIANFAIAPGRFPATRDCWDGNTTLIFQNAATWAFQGMNKGLISDTIGDTPFYTNESNPRTITLHEGESQLVTAWVHATGSSGTHLFFEYVNVTHIPEVGNITDTWTVTLIESDLEPPTGEILSPLNGTFVNGDVTISASAEDNVAVEYVAFQLSVNGGTFLNISGCEEVQSEYTCVLETDAYDHDDALTVRIIPVDTSGNQNTTIDTKTYIVDKDAPLVRSTSVQYPAGKTTATELQNVRIAVNVTGMNASLISSVMLNITAISDVTGFVEMINTTPVIPDEDSVWEYNVTIAEGVSTGTYILEFRVNDSATPDNNQRTDYVQVFIDTTLPEYSSLQRVPSEAYNDSPVHFAGQISDNYKLANHEFYANFSGIMELNRTIVSSNTTSDSFSFSYMLDPGLYEYYYIFYDYAGNSVQTASEVFEVEEAPEANNSIGININPPSPDNNSELITSEIVVNVSVSSANLVSEVVIGLYNEDELIEEIVSGNSETVAVFSNLLSGGYYYNVTAVDDAGNQNSTETFEVMLLPLVDETVPVLDITKNKSSLLIDVDSIRVSWTASDVISGIDSAYFNISSPNGSLLVSSTDIIGSVVLNPENVSVLGQYHIRLWANNTVGNNNSLEETFSVINKSAQVEQDSGSQDRRDEDSRIYFPRTIDIGWQDFTQGYREGLRLNERYRFNATHSSNNQNFTHTLRLNRFNATHADITIQSDPIRIEIAKDVDEYVDIDSDGQADVLVRYEGIEDGRAVIYVQQLSVVESAEEQISEMPIIQPVPETEEAPEETERRSFWPLVILIIVISAIIWYIIQERKSVQ